MAKTAKKKSPAKQPKAARKRDSKSVRRNGTSKAQAIRDAARELGQTTDPAEIIAALATQGITVSSAQVHKTLKAAGLFRPQAAAEVNARVGVKKISYVNRIQKFAVNTFLQINKLGSNVAARASSKKFLERLVEGLERRDR